MAVKMGMMNSKNEVTLDNFKQKLISENAPQGIIAAVEACTVKAMPDPCDTGVALHECVKPKPH